MCTGVGHVGCAEARAGGKRAADMTGDLPGFVWQSPEQETGSEGGLEAHWLPRLATGICCFPIRLVDYLKKFFVRALIRYNPHTIQFTHRKCTIARCRAQSQSCATTTTVHFIALHHPKGHLRPSNCHPPTLPPHSHQSTFCVYRFAYSGHFP